MIAIDPRRFILSGILAAILGVFLIGSGVFLGILGGSFALPIWPVIVLGLLSCGWSFVKFGVAWSCPNALRIDEFGVSGYYVPSLEWSEISNITLEAKAGRLFIWVHDMHAVRMRQINVWRRLRLMGKAVGVPTRGLKCDLAQIEATMHGQLSRIELDKSRPL